MQRFLDDLFHDRGAGKPMNRSMLRSTVSRVKTSMDTLRKLRCRPQTRCPQCVPPACDSTPAHDHGAVTSSSSLVHTRQEPIGHLINGHGSNASTTPDQGDTVSTAPSAQVGRRRVETLEDHHHCLLLKAEVGAKSSPTSPYPHTRARLPPITKSMAWTMLWLSERWATQTLSR